MALVALSSVPMILTGCQNNNQAGLDSAAIKQAIAEADVNLPTLPDKCREHMGRVVPQAGEKWRWVQSRWGIVADQSDTKTDMCATFYDGVKAGYSK